MAAVILHLHIRPAAGKREELLAFLCEARVYYESPGGIRMRVLTSHSDPDALIEVFEYESVEAYELDDRRVRTDPTMQEHLARWRQLIGGPPRVEVYHPEMD